MELKLTDENYCATVVRLDEFIPLPGCDRIKHARVCNSLVIVSAESQKGDWGIYFPIESQINSLFLHDNDLYSNPKSNGNPNKKGFFGNAGRVKAVKLRGFISEGFFAPLSMIFPFAKANLKLGDKFNSVDGVDFCVKYTRPAKVHSTQARASKRQDRIVPGHFSLHDKTKNLRYNIDKIFPQSQISITEKWHGCNAVIGKSLCAPEKSWINSLKEFFGITIPPQYELIWSSRNVIKGVGEAKNEVNHFYGSDVWGYHARQLEDKIPNGFVLYGEIVGWAGEKQIQKGYVYECPFGASRFICFGVKYISPDGVELNFTSTQVAEFCYKLGIEYFIPHYQGPADKLLEVGSNYADVSQWQEEFLNLLEARYIQNQMCQYNAMKVPAEGIVVRVESLEHTEFYKLKNWAFLEMETNELDSPEVSIEEEN
ncbi:RNA ligase domain, REL/Rln2 [uncultured Caudovirales phage]|uniref:RNA ligase domain, REL/Rln2 n=1 Tax=uncultured Caudovirales phage TaxID=2100421 RepID=A0A6J5M944_9CAUD|nr:RNA ligase domain, REL/Rln2 [uncultured Caudovirales phage]